MSGLPWRGLCKIRVSAVPKKGTANKRCSLTSPRLSGLESLDQPCLRPITRKKILRIDGDPEVICKALIKLEES
jgi:uncharacterized protein YggU (UPF0235/DUF167 family)